jgi:hypothetical protein
LTRRFCDVNQNFASRDPDLEAGGEDLNGNIGAGWSAQGDFVFEQGR